MQRVGTVTVGAGGDKKPLNLLSNKQKRQNFNNP